MESEAIELKKAVRIDPAWEFTAPKYYDFNKGESDDDKVTAELWFANMTSYDASPHAGKSKPVAELLNLETQEEMEEVSECSSPDENKENCATTETIRVTSISAKLNVVLAEADAYQRPNKSPKPSNNHEVRPYAEKQAPGQEASPSTPKTGQDGSYRNSDRKPFSVRPPAQDKSPGSVPAKRLHSEGWKEVQVSHAATMPSLKQSSKARRPVTGAKGQEGRQVVSRTHKVQSPASPENPANKKQKLDGGRLRQIKDRVVKPLEPHPPALTRPQEFKFCTDKRSRLHGGADVDTCAQVAKPASPFVSIAEKVRLFQCKTPERFHQNPANQHDVDDHEKRKMKLTRPKTPDFETSHRVVRRANRVKSTAELEEEMLAKIPKFKARPAPRKILEEQPPPLLHKSTPHAPEFQEFHLRTTERALHHKGSGAEQKGTGSHDQLSVATSAGSQTIPLIAEKLHPLGPTSTLSEPRDPHLHTAARARPLNVKSKEEMELEELAKVPKFKARPLNKRIFESRGDLGLFRNEKREVTIPHEFHFSTEERIQQHREPQLADQFGKMSINQPPTTESVLRSTVPEPFNLETENRGIVKEMRFLQDILLREQEEMQARIPRAHPLPFTTDVPEIPPKPEPKDITRPEPFALESCSRHEEVLNRFAEQQKRSFEVEAALKTFRAQPISSMGPVFVPARSRKPLTEVHEFSFHLEARAAERAEFDHKVNEKQNQYKRFREEYEAARKTEEDRSLKALRREMVPHARPMPAYNRPFVPQRSTKELTQPVSPQFNLPSIRLPSTARRRSSGTSTSFFRKKMGQMRC